MPAYVRIREKTVGGFEKKFDGIDTQTDRHSHLVYYSVVGAVVQLVEYRTRNRDVAGSTHTRSTASNLEQVANLLCAQANSASYPQRDGN